MNRENQATVLNWIAITKSDSNGEGIGSEKSVRTDPTDLKISTSIHYVPKLRNTLSFPNVLLIYPLCKLINLG